VTASPNLPPDVEPVIRAIQDDGIISLTLQFTDVMGIVKAVQIPPRQIETAFRTGIWFDGSSLEGFARVAESDMYLRPDAATYSVLPNTGGKSARLICDVYTPSGDPFAGDPRAVLRRALHMAAEMGYRFTVAPEVEFFLLRTPITLTDLQTHDHAGYFDLGEGESGEVQRAIADALSAMTVQIDSLHHEVGGGQHEIDLTPLDALAMADAIVTARQTIKAVAARYGLIATFMPKPLARVAGSGMHVHQTLYHYESGRNCFAEPSAEYGLSKVGRAFLAGQLAHARGMCAVLAPLVNSYKRLVAGLEAPVYITWAQLNRSALIRVPRLVDGQADMARIELRCIDPSCNPYLAFAVMVRAGLEGILHNMELPSAAEEELYLFNARRRQLPTLPTSLHEAISAMEASALISDTLGLSVFEGFLEAKRMEWNDYILDISAWELRRYLHQY